MTSNDMQHDDPRRSEAADGPAPQNGAQAGSHAGGFECGFHKTLSGLVLLFGKLDDQNGVL